LRLEPLGERVLLSTLPINLPVPVSVLSLIVPNGSLLVRLTPAVKAELEMIRETTSATTLRVLLLRHETRGWLEQVYQSLEAHDPASQVREANGPPHGEASRPLPADDTLVFVAGFGAEGLGMGHSLMISREEGFSAPASREASDEIFGANLGSESNPLVRPDWKLPDPWAELAPLDSAGGALVPAFTVRERSPESTAEQGQDERGLNRFVIGLGEAPGLGAERLPATSPAAQQFENRGAALVEKTAPPCEPLLGDDAGESEEGGAE
jgi:hypothetical protein